MSAPATSTSTKSCDDTDKDQGGRQTLWFAIMAFSIIALAALVTNFEGDTNVGDQNSHVKWVVSAISIAFSFATISVLAHLFIPDKFMNTSLETGMATFTAVFWIAAMPAIMDPDNNLAVDSYISGVANLNLYFFSWAAFIVSFLLFMSCLTNTINNLWKKDDTETADAPKKETEHRCSRTLWTGCIVMSFVVMIASSRIFEDIKCGDDINNLGVVSDTYDAICDRTKYGVSLGAISAIIGLVWMAMSMFWLKGAFGTILEFGLALFMIMMWTVGVVLLTFDKDKSPGHGLGNLYFFTWGGWSLFIFLFMASFQNFMSRNEKAETNEGDNAETEDKPAMEPVNEEPQAETTGEEMNV